MDVFNRLAVILCVLLLLGISIIVLLLVTGVIAGNALTFLFRGSISSVVADLDWVTRSWLGAGSLLVFSLGWILLYLEVRPHRRLTLSGDKKSGLVTVSMKSLEKLIDRELEGIASVSKASTQMRAGSDGLHLRSRLYLQPDTGIQLLTRQIQEQCKAIVEQYIGLQVKRISLETHIAHRVIRGRNRRVE